MTWRLEFLNDNFGYQFDDTHPVLSLVAKGVIAPTGLDFYTVVVESNNYPLIALRATGCHAGQESVDRNGTTFTFTIYSIGVGPGATIEWFVYDNPPPTPRTSGWGIEMYNEAGEVIVSDAYPPMKIVGMVSVAGATMAAGKKYAAFTSFSGWRRFYEVELPTFGDPIITEYHFRRCWRWTGTTLSYDEFSTSVAGANSYPDSELDPPFVTVIDVTNH